MNLEQALKNAAQDLPPDCEITLVVSNGKVLVEATDSQDGLLSNYADKPDMTLLEQLGVAVDWCRAQEASRR